MDYNLSVRVRGCPSHEAARKVGLGYELDPAEHRGFALIIPEYMVEECDLLRVAGLPMLAAEIERLKSKLEGAGFDVGFVESPIANPRAEVEVRHEGHLC